MQDVDLSIYMTTYNHSKYVAEAIESVLMQKTKYTYELLIGDDVSPDNTREIIESYRKKYPDIIKAFYRDHNMNNESPNNGADLRNRCRGKYVVALEGDDFWIDENKIEKQVDFLEEHPEYIGVSCRCRVVGDDSEPINEEYPQCDDSEYGFSYFLSEIMPGQLATVMYRNIMLDKVVDYSVLLENISPWDRMLYFVLISHGKIYCIQETLSAYRHVIKGGSSFSANLIYNFSANEKWQLGMLNYAYGLHNPKAIKCAEIMYLTRLARGLSTKNCSVSVFFDYLFKNVKHPVRTLILYVVYKIRKNVLKKKLYLRMD